MATAQSEIDARNAVFWNELCGSALARSLGISTITPQSLRRFDLAYMALYPYLWDYLAAEELAGKRVLEIGLGYGTLGQILAARSARYLGIDIAPGAVAMMRRRAALIGRSGEATATVASALDLPVSSGAFDYVYSIGCLHHTGNLRRALEEIHRVLAPGAKAIVMLYNRNSYRQIERRIHWRPLHVWRQGRSRGEFEAQLRAIYDSNLSGEAAPATVYVSRRQLRGLFRGFSPVRIESRNADDWALLGGRMLVPRARLLSTLGRVAGLDLYVVATKPR